MKKVRIIGAGFSGLSLALELNKLGIQVQIIEAADEAGGLIRSLKTSYGIYETGANAFLSNALVEKFVQELKLVPLRPKADARKRFLFRSYPKRWPLNFYESLVFVRNFLGSLLCGQLQPKNNETIYQWGQRNLGVAATQYILEPALLGIYAGDSKVLSAELILRKKKSAGRNLGLLSFEGGMGELIQKMVQVLISQGTEIRYSSVFDPVHVEILPTVICTGPSQASRILEAWSSIEGSVANSQILQQIEMRPLTTITVYFASAPVHYSGFGILFPQSENRWPLGILQNSNIFQRNESAYSETWIVAGTDHSDEAIVSKIRSEREVIYRETQEPLEIKVTRWPKAIPHYTVEHKIGLEQLVSMNQVWLHGNYLGEIGLGKILARSQRLAAEIKSAV